MSSAPTKQQLLDALEASGREVADTVRAMAAGDLEWGRYENGWNARQILAHLASIEWTYPRLLELAAAPPAGETPAKPASGGIDGYNDRQVSKREGVPVEDLVAEFERNRATTIEAVRSAGDDLLATEIRSAGGFSGPAAQVLFWVAVEHVRGHLSDIAGS